MPQASPAYKATPMVKQYLSIKEKYQDSILFYRMGDFYEMFFEDAVTASPILEIALTSRNKKDESSIPMCGIPVRAVDSYIGRLIDQGHKVAICEQVEDPAAAKGLVKRDVVRVITPGMIIDNELLDEKSNNYIVALSRSGDLAGLSSLDISTGAFRVTESDTISTLIDEALRISPSEIIFSESSRNDVFFKPFKESFSEKVFSFISDKAFDYKSGKDKLTAQFKTRSLEGYGCENLKAGICAAGAILHYVAETQKQKIEHLTSIETYSLENYLIIDDTSCRNLELLNSLSTGSRQGTLIGIIDRCVTSMGGRLLKTWLRYPLKNIDEILARLDAVEEAVNNPHGREEIREALKSVYDLERLNSRINMGRSNARDLVALKISLQRIPEILSILSGFTSEYFVFQEPVERLGHLADLIENAIREDAPPTINDGGIIKPGYSDELDELIKISRDGKGWLASLEAEEKEKTGINSLKVRYNKVFGYYIEVTKTHSADVPPHYIRKQTLVNAERYITDELKTFETKVLGAQERRAALEREIFNRVREEIITHNQVLLNTAGFAARVDCIFNFAEIANMNDYSRPEINTDGMISIDEGRHPVVEKLITGERYVPNTIKMDNDENQVLIITGPNMAGKSTVLRQTALIVLMAQIGSFVPAEAASIPVIDRIFTRVGALDNLSSGQSTFMVEMEETANIMNNATSQSLIILDEIGRGTSTFDGLSIAWAVAEHLHDLDGKGVKTLFATHYHELTELDQTKPRVKNFNIAVKEWNDEIIFLRRLVEGGTNRSYGIQVARLAGLPESAIKRAKKVLAGIEDAGYRPGETIDNNQGKVWENTSQQQLSLFQRPEKMIIDKLTQLNVSNMTPVEALNYLDELIKKAKDSAK